MSWTIVHDIPFKTHPRWGNRGFMKGKGARTMEIENSIVFLPCIDIEQTSQFYREALGLRLAQVQAGGMCRIFDTGYGYLGFCQYGDGRPIPSGPVGVCISLNCPSVTAVDASFAEAVKKGAKAAMPPQRQTRFPVYACFFQDPNGYKVELQRILEDDELTGGRKQPVSSEPARINA